MRLLVSLSVLAAVLLVSTPAGAQSPPPPAAEEIDALLERRQAGDAFWGVYVYDVNADEVLYSRNADRGFLPASNQKLLTTAAALDLLGSTHRYETTLHFDGTAEDSVMRGDLVLKGSGDPTFGSTEIRGEDPFRTWATRLADMGVERIEGRLIGDDRAFHGPPYPEGWTIQYLTRQKGRRMGVSASALSYRDNVVLLSVEPTQPGAPPTVSVRPEGVVSLDNRAETSSRWRGSTLVVDRTFSTNEIVLTGSVGRSYNGGVAVPVSDPTPFALNSFANHLEAVGIETALTHARIDTLANPPSPGDPLFVQLSPPLGEITSMINKESNNFYAEQVFRSYGWGGSSRGAVRRTETFLRTAGIDTRGLQISDGSGLSRKNLLTPRAMGELLTYMMDHPDADAFLSSLPRGGERNTTLASRLYQTDVQAKTGSMEFVRALSGYVEEPDGSRVAFVVFANNYTGPSYQVTQTIDDIVRAIGSPAL